ncbi:MAG: Fe-S cluster assembly protein HesB [Candidatus Thorarchaeota archaeon]|nr:Fe-S cluster assembly protein HesB [Candidatus Thorarchaeota archaeon]
MIRPIDGAIIKDFQQEIMDWWRNNARDLPWRREPTPYHVLVSEIMLQQTQVSRVIPKYHQFLNEFPTIPELARADTRRLLQVWSGLGYNRRALWLREAAAEIVKIGEFPQTPQELRKLKGIGPYTSRSILIFAFNRDLAAVDTNIRRVFIARGFAEEDTTDKDLQEIADTLLLRGRSRDWHNALMDYGAIMLDAASTGITPRTTQSRFKGSTRQVRGAIIKILTRTPHMNLAGLRAELEGEQIKTEKSGLVVEQLVSEGLVSRSESGEYYIPETEHNR